MSDARPAIDRDELERRLIAASDVGMTPAVWAQVKPDAVSIYDPHGTRTFAEINAAANKVARFLRSVGLQPGDPVALLCSNRAEFIEVLQGSLRAGFRLMLHGLSTEVLHGFLRELKARQAARPARA